MGAGVCPLLQQHLPWGLCPHASSFHAHAKQRRSSTSGCSAVHGGQHRKGREEGEEAGGGLETQEG